jgi:hypothetical protein
MECEVEIRKLEEAVLFVGMISSSVFQQRNREWLTVCVSFGEETSTVLSQCFWRLNGQVGLRERLDPGQTHDYSRM